MDASVICCYNNAALVAQLKNSLSDRTERIDWVLVDNTQSRFSSAPAALNHGVAAAKTDLLIFVHQDIEFLSCDAFDDIVSCLRKCPEQIIGAAGVVKPRDKVFSSILQGEGSDQFRFATLSEPMPCFTLDECLFATTRGMLDRLGGFDEVLLNGWHLYAVDLCVRAKEAGFPVVAVPLNVWHKTGSSVSAPFLKYENRFRKKHRKFYRVLSYTCGWCFTNPVLYWLLCLERAVKRALGLSAPL